MKYRIYANAKKENWQLLKFPQFKVYTALTYTTTSYFVIYVGSVVPNELLFNFVLHVDLFRPLRQIAQFDEILFEFFFFCSLK